MVFAKLFENEKYVQILVKIDSDESPEVRTYFKPEGLGVCSFAVAFEDSDDGWDKAEAYFELLTENQCIKMIDSAMNDLIGL